MTDNHDNCVQFIFRHAHIISQKGNGLSFGDVGTAGAHLNQIFEPEKILCGNFRDTN